MKIGSVAWGWTPTPEDMPQGDSLKRIADNVKSLGFDIVDYLSAYDSLDGYFSEPVCKDLAAYTKSIGLEIGGLVFQSDLWNNTDEGVQKTQLAYFKQCCAAAGHMGASTISCIIPGPFGAKPNRKGSPSEKIATNLPADYSWEKDWELFAAMMGKACETASDYGLRIAMECFPHSLCATPHAMLRLIADVAKPNFGIQLDTAHLVNQNIDVETAIFMLGGKKIYNVHAKDSDGLTRGNLPAGSGIVDYTAVLKALKHVGYKGNMSIEVEFTDNPMRYMRQALDHIRMCMKGEY